jgi:hypothetical protein
LITNWSLAKAMLDAEVGQKPTLGTCGVFIPRSAAAYLLVHELTFALNC